MVPIPSEPFLPLFFCILLYGCFPHVVSPAFSANIDINNLSDVRFWTPAAWLSCFLGVAISIHMVQWQLPLLSFISWLS